jgi:hypothetical protein
VKDHEIEQSTTKPTSRPRIRFRDLFWRRPLAKTLWGTCALFWAGFAISLKVGGLAAIYDTLPANYLKILLQPFLVVIMLTPRFVVAWIESHDWVEAEDLDPNAWPNGPLAGPGSTYGDPSNPRSGVMYLRHFGGWDEKSIFDDL